MIIFRSGFLVSQQMFCFVLTQTQPRKESLIFSPVQLTEMFIFVVIPSLLPLGAGLSEDYSGIF